MRVPDPEEQPTMSVPEAGKAAGVSRNLAYEQARRFIDTNGAEGLPCIAFGTRLRVPTAALRQMLGLDAPAEPDGADVPSLKVVNGS